MSKIYILGSINVDYTTVVDEIPVAGETVTGNQFFSSFGGKGANQAVACVRQGVPPVFIGCIGDDVYGLQIKSSFQSMNIDVSNIDTVHGSTGSAIIILDKNDNRIIVNPGANHQITFSHVKKGLESAKAGDILLLQLETKLDIVRYAIEVAKKKKMIVVLNAAPALKLDENLLSKIDLLIVNETEAELMTGLSVPMDAINHFAKLGVKETIITLGSKGAITNKIKVDAYKVDAVDTTAAGDTFVGTLLAKVSMGENLEDAIKYSNAASALAVLGYGAQSSIPTKEDTENFINNYKESYM